MQSKKEKETWKTTGIKKKLTSPKAFLHGKKCQCFQAHQDTTCHKVATSYQLTISQCQDVGELTDNQQSKKRSTERKYLFEVIQCLSYLGRQGVALQGHDGTGIFTQLLRLLSTNEKNILYPLEGKIENKYMHNNVQNEILDIMAVLTWQVKLQSVDTYDFVASNWSDVFCYYLKVFKSI